MKMATSLEKNVKAVYKKVRSDDVKFTKIKAGSGTGVLIYVKDMVDKDKLGELIIGPLYSLSGKPTESKLEKCFLSPEKTAVSDTDKVVSAIVSGDAALIIDGIKTAFVF